MLTCERLRITAGVPRVGAELDPSVIPAEVGRWFVDGSASFTKGCYTGQELVARVDSRGSNTPRHLRVITVTGGVPSVGDDVVVDGAGHNSRAWRPPRTAGQWPWPSCGGRWSHRRRRWWAGSGLRSRRHRQPDPESGSRTRSALDADPGTHPFRQLGHDGQPEPGPAARRPRWLSAW